MTITSSNRLRYEPLYEALIPVLMEIEEEAYPEPWTTGMFREEMRNRSSYFYVVYCDETLIGYCGFWLLIDDAHVTSVTVAEAYRGEGYGREQMNHLIAVARAKAAVTMTLEVRESNTPAREMYNDFGFEQIGVRKGYYGRSGEDAIVMRLPLDTQPDE